MKIALGGDHAGYNVKKLILDWLAENGKEFFDFGSFSEDKVDYPDYVHPLCKAVVNNQYDLGILVCGTGNGVAITANKYPEIRAGLSWNENVAKLVRQHNNANILCIPARFVAPDEIIPIVKAFLSEEFEGGRHADRVNKISC